ncbi:hypothetical protein QN344_08080, partial [Mucilaginibacter sp. 5B2]|nr:hypothetical protein [Mucilaginibacter sp. 5B2]
MNDKLRIETAVEILNDRLPYQVGELYMGIDEKGYLNITMASISGDLKNISKSSALRELEEITLLFSKMKV